MLESIPINKLLFLVAILEIVPFVFLVFCAILDEKIKKMKGDKK